MAIPDGQANRKIGIRLTLAMCLPVLFALISGLSDAQSRHRKIPHFQDYPVSSVYHGKNAPVEPKYARLTFPETKLDFKKAAQEKPNFAGHYVLVEDDCGSSCTGIEAIDAKTGKVYELGPTLDNADPDVDPPYILYRLRSKLIILKGARDSNEHDYGTHYYLFQRNKFVHLLTINKPRGKFGE